jgi:Tfp pilus assembly protein PilW
VRWRQDHWKRGQTMVEFMVVAGMILAAAAILSVFLVTFNQYGTRVLELVGSEYP